MWGIGTILVVVHVRDNQKRCSELVMDHIGVKCAQTELGVC
jgi:hypothetical protein